MRVLVCGGRHYANRDEVDYFLDRLSGPEPITKIICGGARGADQLAIDWAMDRKVGFEVHYADWHHNGRAAGPLRNDKMLRQGNPDRVVAFPGGRGTADMVRRARKAGLRVYIPYGGVDDQADSRTQSVVPPQPA